MKHFDAEEIARFAEGHVDEPERERFISHLAECGVCFKAYADTLKFVGEDKKHKIRLQLPGFEKIKIAVRRLRQDIGSPLRNRKLILVPSFALLVVMVFMVPFLLNTIRKGRIINAQIRQIAADIENIESHSFAPNRDEAYAAVRAGFFVEDLTLLVNAAGNNKNNKELQQKILLLLNNELKVFADEKNPIFTQPADIDKKNFNDTVRRIRERIENHSRGGLFQLGRFVEQGILSTFEKKRPGQEQIGVYEQIARRYGLPPGIYNNLGKLKVTTGFTECKRLLITIKEIILS